MAKGSLTTLQVLWYRLTRPNLLINARTKTRLIVSVLASYMKTGFNI
ncbi:hypothetical protein ACU8KH_04997 [Lachancea thermotolerans]